MSFPSPCCLPLPQPRLMADLRRGAVYMRSLVSNLRRVKVCWRQATSDLWRTIDSLRCLATNLRRVATTPSSGTGRRVLRLLLPLQSLMANLRRIEVCWRRATSDLRRVEVCLRCLATNLRRATTTPSSGAGRRALRLPLSQPCLEANLRRVEACWRCLATGLRRAATTPSSGAGRRALRLPLPQPCLMANLRRVEVCWRQATSDLRRVAAYMRCLATGLRRVAKLPSSGAGRRCDTSQSKQRCKGTPFRHVFTPPRKI